MRAIANDISRSFAPSSIPGSRWQCRSINLLPYFRHSLSPVEIFDGLRPFGPTVKTLDSTSGWPIKHNEFYGIPRLAAIPKLKETPNCEVMTQLSNTPCKPCPAQQTGSAARICYLTTERPFIARFLMLIGCCVKVDLRWQAFGDRAYDLDQNTSSVDEARTPASFFGRSSWMGCPMPRFGFAFRAGKEYLPLLSRKTLYLTSLNARSF